MIRLARSPSITGFMHRNAHASALARRFVGGAAVAEVAQTAVDLKRRGFDASLFYLGEYVADPQLVNKNVAQKISVSEELGRRGLDVHVSIDPTQVGYLISDELGRNNSLAIGYAIAAQPRTPRSYLMLDMEDYGGVDKTLNLAAFLRGEGIWDMPSVLSHSAISDITGLPTTLRPDRGSGHQVIETLSDMLAAWYVTISPGRLSLTFRAGRRGLWCRLHAPKVL